MGIPHLVEVLSERLDRTDLQSLLLTVYRQLAKKVTAPQLLEHYQTNRFVAPSTLDPRRLADFEALAWRLLPTAYVPVELSPVCPLGTNSVIASVDQSKVVSTIRNTEVVADSTNVLALEAARRRRALRGVRDRKYEPALLAASHRVTRAQLFTGPQTYAHFRLLALCASGRDEGSFDFESARLLEQLTYYVELLQRLSAAGGPFLRYRIALTDLTEGARSALLQQRVVAPLSERYAELTCGLDPSRASGKGYYQEVCFKIYAADAAGNELEIGDGGLTDWTQQLLSDRKERLLIGGLGVDRLLLPSGSTR